MHGIKLLHNLFGKALASIHKSRLSSLLDAVNALLIGKQLSLTLLGRNIVNDAKQRHNIRKVDRLLGNTNLHQEIPAIYRSLCLIILSGISRPLISVDWACVNKLKDWHILRATLNIKGRGITLYQELYPRGCENSSTAESKFLLHLKKILPDGCRPIIVTDAGFGCPWFKKVENLGFDFVGRIRNHLCYQKAITSGWKRCLDLYSYAKVKVKEIGKVLLGKSEGLNCRLVLIRKRKCHRKYLNRSGYPLTDTASNRCRRRSLDPWLLVTSLSVCEAKAEKVIEIYTKRMQIEEDFRDTKSHRYGFSLRYSQSYIGKRIEVLLLIAALASVVCWLVSLATENKNMQFDYQANSTRNRRVLSIIYLACQIIRRKVKFKWIEIQQAYVQWRSLIQEASLC